MAVDSVQGSNLDRNTVIAESRKTLIAAGIGAAVSGGCNYAGQKVILKDPKTYINGLKETRDIIIDTFSTEAKKSKVNKKELNEAINAVKEGFKKPIEYAENLAKSGKVNWKEVGKKAGIGAVVVFWGYLAYRGIKALCSNKAE